MRLGLMGGTFDPIHYGHLILADEACHQLGLERVLFVPARQPPHRARAPEAGAEHRYVMALLATADHPRFDVSRIELERAGPSYTVDTVRALQREWGAETEITLLLGADAARELLTWHRHAELIRLCTLAVANRPGAAPERLADVLPADYLARIRTLTIPGVEISATEIRTRLRAGRSIRYLVPSAVAAYIDKYRLYRGAAPDTGGTR